VVATITTDFFSACLLLLLLPSVDLRSFFDVFCFFALGSSVSDDMMDEAATERAVVM